MNNLRRRSAWNKRNEANEMANQRPHPKHYANGDEQKFRHTKESEMKHLEKCDDLNEDEAKGKLKEDHKDSDDLKKGDVEGKSTYMVSFTKGLPHNHITGLVNDPKHFQYFVKAVDSGDPRDFRDTPLGAVANMGHSLACKLPAGGWESLKAKKGKFNAKEKDDDKPVKVRAWESQSAGLSYELQGPDAQAVTMPPAPELGSAELTGEMAEVYAQAILRDVPFNRFSQCAQNKKVNKNLHIENEDKGKAELLLKSLNDLDWFNGDKTNTNLGLSEREQLRRRTDLNLGNAFRGLTEGDDIGPYLSQFLLVGNKGIHEKETSLRSPKEGLISYGSLRIDQRVRVAEQKNYLTNWEEWFDVQNGADLRSFEQYNDNQKYRFIYTPRDLATYVHYDALYEAYLNACLILLGNKTPFDPGIPFQESDNRDHQQGFAHFGGPHLLSLVTEVATRALKAVRFQKYNVHRRCRPEVLAARVHKNEHFEHIAPELMEMFRDLKSSKILDFVAKENGSRKNYLLPMAFCEGSPMHPAYGAGHATVAGACVTILKAFFDCKRKLNIVDKGDLRKDNKFDISKLAYVPIKNGTDLAVVPVYDKDCNQVALTIEGELNKLASNISIGRNWAGVHYFTDYYESLLMGEQIAIGILEEQKLMFGENFSMTLPLFGGRTIRI